MTISLINILNEDSPASQQAKQLGLTYMQFGRWGKDGTVTHKTQGDKLIPVGQSDVPNDNDVDWSQYGPDTDPFAPLPKKTRGQTELPLDDPRGKRPDKETEFANAQAEKKTLKKLSVQMNKFDWDFDMSDDHQAWRKGSKQKRELIDTLAGSGYSKDKAMQLVAKIAPGREDDLEKMWKHVKHKRQKMNQRGQVPGKPAKDPAQDTGDGMSDPSKDSNMMSPSDTDSEIQRIKQKVQQKNAPVPGVDEPTGAEYDDMAAQDASQRRGEMGLDMDPPGDSIKTVKTKHGATRTTIPASQMDKYNKDVIQRGKGADKRLSTPRPKLNIPSAQIDKRYMDLTRNIASAVHDGDENAFRETLAIMKTEYPKAYQALKNRFADRNKKATPPTKAKRVKHGTYRMSPGQYQNLSTDNRWELYKSRNQNGDTANFSSEQDAQSFAIQNKPPEDFKSHAVRRDLKKK